MELRHLRYFVAVAKTCHFGQAAQTLHIAQPALSQAIRQLESDLGVLLLIRTTRHARLTPAGELLQREAVRILDHVDEAVDGVRRVAAGELGVLRLGLTGTAAVSHLPAIARAVHRDLPGLVLDIHADRLTPSQCDGLRDGTLDLGVLRPPTTGDGIATRTIAVEPLCLAMPIDHRLASSGEIAMTDLRAETFVVFDKPDSAVNHAMRRSCARADFAPDRVHLAPDIPVILSLVAAGLGVALVPDGARRTATADVVFRSVDDAVCVELALAWRADDVSPLVTSVVSVLEHAGLFEDSHEEVSA
jgi:DNA-binding transcriptional LysR family regulator